MTGTRKGIYIKIAVCLAIMVNLMVFAINAYAAGGGGGVAHESQGFLADYGWQILNFAILVAILGFAMVKADVRGLLTARTEGIRKAIVEATQAREAAEQALTEVQARLAKKDMEIKRIITASTLSGESERDMLHEEGRRLSEKLVEQAKSNIRMELEQARKEIRAEAVELAMELAEQKLIARLDGKRQRQLLEESIEKLEGRN